ncbi:hypothetical protein FCL41_11965 [Nocardioides jishulii]|uniref:hypothetical protein n=1 Tax=Nocardioides jishulii TaxID=2575440 RepID=UPI00110E77B8|nr:hypothetical protein [Nocardioides jishulii]QCX28155.1 hypothetical protein FCL41_11965 [Nocardioides jishulii]
MASPTPLLRLRRGVPVLPRGDGLVLVGTDPEHHVVLPDTASVARLLAQLRLGLPSATSRQTPDDPTATVLAALRRAGLVVEVDEQALLSDARAATRVSVQAPDPWLPAVQECVRLAGLALATGQGDVTWVVSAGPPDWEVHDALLAGEDPRALHRRAPLAHLPGAVRAARHHRVPAVPGGAEWWRTTATQREQ